MKRIINIFLIILVISNSPSAFSQKIKEERKNKKIRVSGYVTNLTGDPVKGAVIILDERTTSTKTDEDGYYHIKVKPAVKLIAAYKQSDGAAETVFIGQENLDFSLSPTLLSKYDRSYMPGKVDIGYQEVNEDLSTDNIGTIDHSDNRMSHYSTIYEMIRGEVPGVIVSGNSITIRGVATVNGTTEPLFVVNGMYMNDISSIHPDMVESIEVLKGADASIYGMQGANGVIIIKTKTR